MRGLYILIAFIIMFLSCGNSTTVVPEFRIFKKPSAALLASSLSREQKAMATKLDELFTRLNKIGTFNGSVLVAKAGKVIFRKSMGFLNKTTKDVLTDSSMFQLASVSKVITATTILMMHEREMLDINETFQHYFPDFPYPNVRIRDLLNHRSGLPNYIYTLNTEFYQTNYQMSNVDMYAYFVSKNTKPYLRPDTRFNYCNTNYALLGLLIEKISGKPYSQFLREELFIPLGMKNTATIKDIDLNGMNITHPYDTRWRPVEFDASDYVLGDKSIYSTPYDLFLFSEALYQNKIIKPETQQLAYTAFSKEIKLNNYGFGWRMKNFNDPDKKEVYHNGWWHGYKSSFHRRLKDTLTVVILSNQLNRAAYQTNQVYEILDNVSEGSTEDDDE